MKSVPGVCYVPNPKGIKESLEIDVVRIHKTDETQILMDKNVLNINEQLKFNAAFGSANKFGHFMAFRAKLSQKCHITTGKLCLKS